MNNPKQDIRHYGDRELSLYALNEEPFYNLFTRAARWNRFADVQEFIDENYIYTSEQLDDLKETFETEKSEWE